MARRRALVRACPIATGPAARRMAAPVAVRARGAVAPVRAARPLGPAVALTVPGPPSTVAAHAVATTRCAGAPRRPVVASRGVP